MMPAEPIPLTFVACCSLCPPDFPTRLPPCLIISPAYHQISSYQRSFIRRIHSLSFQSSWLSTLTIPTLPKWRLSPLNFLWATTLKMKKKKETAPTSATRSSSSRLFFFCVVPESALLRWAATTLPVASLWLPRNPPRQVNPQTVPRHPKPKLARSHLCQVLVWSLLLRQVLVSSLLLCQVWCLLLCPVKCQVLVWSLLLCQVWVWSPLSLVCQVWTLVFPNPQLQMLRVLNLRLEKSVLRAVEESGHVKGQQVSQNNLYVLYSFAFELSCLTFYWLILKATLERTRAKGKGRALQVPAVLEWAPAKGIMRARIIPAVLEATVGKFTGSHGLPESQLISIINELSTIF